MDVSANRSASLAVNGEDWIGQTIIFARGLAAVSLLAGGVLLIFADWNVMGMPVQF